MRHLIQLLDDNDELMETVTWPEEPTDEELIALAKNYGAVSVNVSGATDAVKTYEH